MGKFKWIFIGLASLLVLISKSLMYEAIGIAMIVIAGLFGSNKQNIRRITR